MQGVNAEQCGKLYDGKNSFQSKVKNELLKLTWKE